MNPQRILLLGGDARVPALGAFLSRAGAIITYYGLRGKNGNATLAEALATAGAVILPLPCSRDSETLFAPLFDETVELQDVAAGIRPGTVVLGGRLPQEFCEQLQDCDVIDYADSEELALMNAVPTAEGVVALLLERLPVTVQGLACAVVGYGRIGKATARLLQNMDACVTVFARSGAALAEARSRGLNAEPLTDFGTKLRAFGAVVNTVPAPVLGKIELAALPKPCLLIETASAPFGIDFAAAKELELPVCKAGGLPGTVAPQTAGENLARVLCPLLQKKGLIA